METAPSQKDPRVHVISKITNMSQVFRLGRKGWAMFVFSFFFLVANSSHLFHLTVQVNVTEHEMSILRAEMGLSSHSTNIYFYNIRDILFNQKHKWFNHTKDAREDTALDSSHAEGFDEEFVMCVLQTVTPGSPLSPLAPLMPGPPWNTNQTQVVKAHHTVRVCQLCSYQLCNS